MTDITEWIQASHDRIGGFPAPVDGSAGFAAASLSWMSRGACQGEDPELFFPIATEGPALLQISAAKEVCRHCAVAAMCLAYALQTRQTGIWGGTTQEERRAMTEPCRWHAGEQTGCMTAPGRPILPGQQAGRPPGAKVAGIPGESGA